MALRSAASLSQDNNLLPLATLARRSTLHELTKEKEKDGLQN